MAERYKVRCTVAKGRAMAGMYAVSLTGNGVMATWKPDRAAVQTCRVDAELLASHVARNFSGTVWTVEPVGVVQ